MCMCAAYWRLFNLMYFVDISIQSFNSYKQNFPFLNVIELLAYKKFNILYIHLCTAMKEDPMYLLFQP